MTHDTYSPGSGPEFCHKCAQLSSIPVMAMTRSLQDLPALGDPVWLPIGGQALPGIARHEIHSTLR
jgi:hypothetical protein